MWKRERESSCLSDGIFYEHKHDLGLDLDSWELPAVTDKNNVEIFGAKMFPVYWLQAKPAVLIMPHKQQQQQQKNTP